MTVMTLPGMSFIKADFVAQCTSSVSYNELHHNGDVMYAALPLSFNIKEEQISGTLKRCSVLCVFCEFNGYITRTPCVLYNSVVFNTL